MTQTAVQIGNSVGLIIPSEYKKKMGIRPGTKITTNLSPDGGVMYVSKVGGGNKTSLTPEFLNWLEKFNKEYDPALKKLAQK